MTTFNKYLQYVWYICTDNLIPIAPYTAIGTMDADCSSSIPAEPIEGGQLAAYNNIRDPARVNCTLFFDGDYAVQVLALAMLDHFMSSNETCTIFSPTWIWRNMALDHFTYSRAHDAGATLLAVDCSFVEIRSVSIESETYSTETSKKATSSSKVNTGQTSTTEKKNTFIYSTIWK